MNTGFFTQIESVLAVERLDAYRQDGANEITTLSRYLLNLALCEALYSPLQFAEIALRNAIHTQLTQRYQADDWYDVIPGRSLPPWQAQQILKAKDALTEHGKPITPGGMVAELTFGFWSGFFNNFHARSGLGHHLARNAFPHAPGPERSLHKLDAKWRSVRTLRNRVFHHERILHWQDLNGQHDNMLQLVGWMNPELEEMARILDRFSKIRSEGLDPWLEKMNNHWPRA